ncbi:F-box/kelch-repeat protein At3g06240-like [Tripterygium wilfordii]|uniref:F-box/kelch-repeat protein At3g06240-like n=1 Tax=Tripterygium wilfordii TaxID=458696 RepID=UPI0018F8303C|nr:F-box/kelch-repeat protein At3g06240-like [Tripterygium wilfordii]
MMETNLIDRVELYSLKNDSWREIPHVDNVLTRHIPCLDDNYGVSYNGICHWQAVDSDGKRLIMSFDVGDEVLEKLPLPDLDGYDYYKSQHAILNGLPAVIFVKLERSEKCLDVWVMSEHGAKKSWVKLPSIGPFSGIQRPLGFSKNGELFWEDIKGQLVLYDASTQLVKNLQLSGCSNTLQVSKTEMLHD